MPLLFPPFRCREPRRAPLDLARKRERSAPHLDECPAWLNANVDMDSARAAGFGPAAQSHFFKKLLYLHRHLTHIAKFDARTGIQVHPQFIRMIQICRANRMGVKFDGHPKLTIQINPAPSSTTTSSASLPDGKVKVTVRSQDGLSVGARF